MGAAAGAGYRAAQGHGDVGRQGGRLRHHPGKRQREPGQVLVELLRVAGEAGSGDTASDGQDQGYADGGGTETETLRCCCLWGVLPPNWLGWQDVL